MNKCSSVHHQRNSGGSTLHHRSEGGEGANGAQQRNYSLGMLEELVKPLSEPMQPTCSPSPATPRLVDRLSKVARERLGLSVFGCPTDDGRVQGTVEQ